MSALDHLAYELVVSNDGDGRTAQFPVSTSDMSSPSLINGRLKGAGDAAIEFVTLLKAYKGGDDLVWIIRELDRIDKHQLLLAAASAHQNTRIRMLSACAEDRAREVPSSPFLLNPPVRKLLEGKTEVSRNKMVSRDGQHIDWTRLKVQMDMGFIISVTVSNVDALEGGDVLAVLKEGASRISAVIIEAEQRVAPFRP